LLARADIVDVVGRAVQLKKAGSNYKGLCPFHGEKSASFNVNPVRQTYHCFGCGVHGDALRFLMEHAGLSFVEAVRELAGELGMQIPEDEASPQDREREQRQREQRRTLGDVLARAMTHYRQQLKASPRAIDYLKGRGLTGEIAARFGLGYAPGGWHGLAGAFGQYDDPLLVESGLVILQDKDDAGGAEQRRYDRFRDRVMFPIRNVRGEVIGFGGRVLDQGEPKYLNSPETPVFVKGRELYGLFEARVGLRNRGYALVTEGYMDVVALAQLGFENAVATLGTACTAEHVAKLLKFTEQVVFSFDGDAAGRRAAARAMEAVLPHATDTRSFRFLFLPTEHDPDSFVREFGAEAFEARVREALPLSRQLLDLAADGCDLATPEGRARMLATARPWFEQMPEGLLREQLRAALARAGGVSDEVLANHWRQHAPRGGTGSTRRDEAAAPPAQSHAEPWGADPSHWSAEPDPSAGYEPRHDEASRGGNRSGAGSGSGRNWKEWKDWKDQSGNRSGRGGRWRDRQDQPPMPIRPPPRATDLPDRAAWLLLRHCGLWLALSAEVHDELVHLPAPHGELFAALERVLHDQGALAMPELLDALRHEADGIDALTHLLERLRGLHDIEDDADPLTEVLIVVMRLRLHELDEQIRLLASSPLQDSTERDRFRELQQTQQRMQAELQALRTQSKPDRI
jgi:DNA primase